MAAVKAGLAVKEACCSRVVATGDMSSHASLCTSMYRQSRKDREASAHFVRGVVRMSAQFQNSASGTLRVGLEWQPRFPADMLHMLPHKPPCWLCPTAQIKVQSSNF
jgi:hypothetical protein